MSNPLGVQLEWTAAKAGDDFVLTRDELLAIFMAHVPTTGGYYNEILAAFETQIDKIDYDVIAKDFEQKVKSGVRQLTLTIPVDINVKGTVTEVPVTITTNIEVTANKQDTTKYLITHDVKINGKLVDKTPAAVTEEVDKITGQLVSWIDGAGGGKDKLEATKQGAKYSATLTDVSTDPIIQGGKVYEAKILGSDLAIKQGDHRNTLVHNRGIEVALTSVMAPIDGDQFMARTVSGGEAGMLNRFKYNYVALYDSADQTYDLVTEV